MNIEEEIIAMLRERPASDLYLRLEAFEKYAQNHPQASLQAAWRFITESEYIDDGTCCALLEICVENSGRDQIEALILREWPHLDDSARLNIIDGACSQKAMSTELGIALFYKPETNTQQRHRIVVGFAAGDHDRHVNNIVTLAKQIGSYTEPHRQAVLEDFVKSVIHNYS